MLYLYAPTLNDGVIELAKSIGGKRLKKFDGISFWKFGKRLALKEGDIVVCWGKPLPEIDGVRILNGGEPSNKLRDLKTLMNLGSLTVPYRNQMYPTYLQRSNKSVGGNDLLKGTLAPDFYTNRLNFSQEVVIHSFDGRTIRSGKKVPKDGLTVAPTVEDWNVNPTTMAHPWIRTDLGGWKVDYEGFKSTITLRKQAATAVKQLELTFGVVTLGMRSEDERYYIIGVDRAPIIEGVTINSYSRAINRWMKNEKPEGEEETEHAEVPLAPPDYMQPIHLDARDPMNIPIEYIPPPPQHYIQWNAIVPMDEAAAAPAPPVPEAVRRARARQGYLDDEARRMLQGMRRRAGIQPPPPPAEGDF